MLNDFVDKVFVINLVEREQRLKDTTGILEYHNIDFTIWPAIKQDDGKFGLRLTMSQLFRYCLEMEYERVCVFEDDIKIVCIDFLPTVEKCLAQLPTAFDLFYFGGNIWKTPTKISENLLFTPCIYSTHAVIYSRDAIQRIINKLHQSKAYDVILVEGIQKQNMCYCAYPLLISQRSGYSDVENKNINYEVFIEKRYHEKTRGL